MSKIFFGKIKSIVLDKNKMFINFETGEQYYSKIIKGSVKCKILNEQNKIVSLFYLKEEDLIKIEISENIIKKIYITSRYQFISDSSEEEYLSN
jgi:hypothetical protein